VMAAPAAVLAALGSARRPPVASEAEPALARGARLLAKGAAPEAPATPRICTPELPFWAPLELVVLANGELATEASGAVAGLVPKAAGATEATEAAAAEEPWLEVPTLGSGFRPLAEVDDVEATEPAVWTATAAVADCRATDDPALLPEARPGSGRSDSPLVAATKLPGSLARPLVVPVLTSELELLACVDVASELLLFLLAWTALKDCFAFPSCLASTAAKLSRITSAVEAENFILTS